MPDTQSAHLPADPAKTFVYQRFINAAREATWSEYRGQGAHFSIRAFLSRRGKTADLGTLGGKISIVTGLNALGHVIGESSINSNIRHAFLWRQGQMTDLGTLPGGLNSQASAINDADQVVGFSENASQDMHAFLWQAGMMRDLGALPQGHESYAKGLNNRGEVVGSALAADGEEHAVLWRGGHIHDLNRLIPYRTGLALNTVENIGDNGEIVVSGRLDGWFHKFRLIPRRD